MDRRRRARDVLLCHLCESPGPPMYCDKCETHLCKPCVGEHISDESKLHKVGVYKKQESSAKHRKCSSKKHKTQDVIDVDKILESQRQVIEKDLRELETSIFPKYQVMASNIPIQKDELHKNSNKLKMTIDKSRENLRKEIDTICMKLKSSVEEMDAKLLGLLDRQGEEIKKAMSGISKSIDDIKRILNSRDVTLFSNYKSKNAEFQKFPPVLNISLPRFIDNKIDKEELCEKFGFLSSFKLSYRMNSPWAESESSLKYRPLIDEPHIVTQINTEYGDTNKLHTVFCMSLGSDEDASIWTCGDDNRLRLYNLRGKLIKSVRTMSGNRPWDVAVNKSGDPVYTDYKEKTVNILKNSEIQTVVRLPQRWNPASFCMSSTGDMLVLLDCDNDEETKIVRYAGSSEIQSIQYNSIDGKPLFLNTGCHSHICENRNFDIIVSDCGSGSVIGVNQAGQLRFKYTGPPSATDSPYNDWFHPFGIATDRQSRILVADCSSKNNRIHILDADGHFLRYIDNCHLQGQMSLFIDKKDNLFVSEWGSGKIKKIKYCQ